MKWHLTRSSVTEYYDIETGEQITKHNMKQNYVRVKTDETITYNQNKTHEHKYRTVQCRRKPQLNLGFDNYEEKN